LLPLVAISVSAILSSVFSVGVYFFCRLEIDSVAGTTFAGIVIFLMSWLLVLGISLYCTVRYSRFHRTLLLIIIIAGCFGLGIFAYSIATISDELFSCVHTLWQASDEESIENLRQLFECSGFSLKPPEPGEPPTCADTIRDYIDTKTRELGTAFGICSIVYSLFGIGCIYLSCKIQDGYLSDEKAVAFTDGVPPEVTGLEDALNPKGNEIL
jgi:hypothetical protein